MLLDKLAFTENKYEELSVKISDPSIMANQKEWRKLCKEHADLEIIVTAYREYKKVVEDLEANKEMLEEETDKEMKEMLEMVLKKGKKPLVIDADGLNIISRFNMKIEYPYGTIMTPHLMEAARLMSCDIAQIKEDLCQSAQDLAEKYHCTAVLKDATTIVAREDDLVYINQSGNDGMATGGSGDVLAGMITGLLGEGLSVHEAAVHGVYLHGLAGDHAKHDLGAYSMIASDIIAHIKDVTGGNYEPVL